MTALVMVIPLVMVSPIGEGVRLRCESVFRSLCWKCCRGGEPVRHHSQRAWIVSQVAPGVSDGTQPADLDGAGRPRESIGACRSRTNADDRLPRASLGRVESGDGIV